MLKFGFRRKMSMPNIPGKNEIAKTLADAHRKFEPGIIRIIRVLGDREDDPSEPVKLLEVNPDTSPSGIVPIAFGPDPPDIPFASVIIDITEGEYEDFRNGALSLPEGWRPGDTLYPTTA
jgi:hypothetical protein